MWRRLRTFVVAIAITLFAGISVVAADTTAPTAAPSAGNNRFIDSLYKAIDKTAEKSKVYQTGGEGGLTTIIGTIIQTLIGFLGVAAVGLFIYAGYLWMTAGGDEGQVDKSKTIKKQVVVGFIVLSLAYGIVSYVFYAISVAGNVQK